ncbi:hypothetical protein FACUT_8995 [Fusarium acutatum]|uniref:C2H2-type domain-containing protein n=1 Tax=Fusarium acutatum TaxID=78861 RepID=A0A8H4JI95_9HYPO|nr:hypothetical protein FACUT_8995 [Fusarium acutatum]
MNPGNSEPRQVASESSLQSSRRANKRRRHDQNGGGDERDGQKWPQGRVAIVSFECPFCKLDPHRYAECKGYQLTRLSDVMQHLSRQHRILEVTLGSDETVREHDIVLYCARCRYLFHGLSASHKRDIHMNQEIECQLANIEQTGVMLEGEFEGLKSQLRSYPRHDETFRWNIIWKWCFPGKPCPPSPYVEISVPRLEVESILQNGLGSIPGLEQEEVQSMARLFADRIFNNLPEPRSSPYVPPQGQSDSVQTAPGSNYHAPTYLPSNPAFASQHLQQQTQGVRYSSGLPYLGVHGTPTGGQRANSFHWNNTLINNSTPSRVPGSGSRTTSGNNFVHSGDFTAPASGYPPFPYIQYSTDIFESESQDDEYLNTRGNTSGRRGSEY